MKKIKNKSILRLKLIKKNGIIKILINAEEWNKEAKIIVIRNINKFRFLIKEV